MRVAFLNYFYEPDLKDGEALLERYSTLTGWAEAVSEAGACVTVIHRFSREMSLDQKGIPYSFIRDEYPPQLRPWQIPRQVHRQVIATRPSVVHIHGLFHAVQAASLRKGLPPSSAMVMQHHAEMPCTGSRGLVQRWCLRKTDAFFFASREIGKIWTEKKIIGTMDKVYAVMEGSTRFKRQDREKARAKTKMTGSPVLLWVGRLNENKDPLTVLEAFAQARPHMTQAKLYMIFSSDELLPRVQSKMNSHGGLEDSVRLLGQLPHPVLEDYYNSADYFLLGSHYEGSGFALAEALACGVVPVVTDIPSFRMMTDQGNIGALWQPGNVQSCKETLLAVIQRPLHIEADAAYKFFQKKLSFPAIGRRAFKIYKKLVDHRG